MDRNGYNRSILVTTSGECYLCGRYRDTARHEIYGGTGTRALSKRYGLWVNICPECHDEVHANPNCEKAAQLRSDAQDAWVREGRSLDEFKRIFITGNIKHWEIE